MCLIVWAQSIDLLVPPSCFSDRWKESGGECNHRCRRPADCTGKLTTWHGSTMRAFQICTDVLQSNHLHKCMPNLTSVEVFWHLNINKIALNHLSQPKTLWNVLQKNKNHRKMVDVKLHLVIAKVKKGPFITNEK